MKKILITAATLTLLSLTGAMSHAADNSGEAKKQGKKVYNEVEFVKIINNKSKQQIIDTIGKPVKKAQASKPLGAESAVQKFGSLDNSKKDNVEMWYYNNIVRYDAKHTYSRVELTFVNDRCQNVAYFNEQKK